MSSPVLHGARSLWASLRILVVFTLILGVAYPLFVTGVGQSLLSSRANGSILKSSSGQQVGSSLIGQSFTDESGRPIPRYFQPRPSAAGDGYDATASGGTNFGPESPELIADIAARRAYIAAVNGVTEDQVPADAVTSSASGLDPDISPDYAGIQIHRVASARHLGDGGEERVRDLVEQFTKHPDLGFIGDPVVNVVELNLALDSREGNGDRG